jgi:hypothetical protein
MLEVTEAELAKARPVTQDEIKQAYEKQWLNYNRPRAVRTVQVLFRVNMLQDDTPIREQAERVHAAVQGTHNLREFGKAAQEAFEEGEAAPQIYEMPPLAGDGRLVPTRPSDFNVTGVSMTLAQAASALSNPGDISEVVGSEKGFHIFFATEVIPEKRAPLKDVEDEIRRGVLSERVRQAADEITKKPKVRVVRRRDDIAKLLSLITGGT